MSIRRATAHCGVHYLNFAADVDPRSAMCDFGLSLERRSRWEENVKSEE